VYRVSDFPVGQQLQFLLPIPLLHLVRVMQTACALPSVMLMVHAVNARNKNVFILKNLLFLFFDKAKTTNNIGGQEAHNNF